MAGIFSRQPSLDDRRPRRVELISHNGRPNLNAIETREALTEKPATALLKLLCEQMQRVCAG